MTGYEELGTGAVGRVRPLPNGVLAEGSDGQASSSSSSTGERGERGEGRGERGELGRPVSQGVGGGGGGGGMDISVAEFGLRFGAVLCFQKRLSAATRLQLLQVSASGGGAGRGGGVGADASACEGWLALPTVASFLSTFVGNYRIALRPLNRGTECVWGGSVREEQGDVTITVASGASCRHLLALLTAAVSRESGDGGGADRAGRGEGARVGGEKGGDVRKGSAGVWARRTMGPAGAVRGATDKERGENGKGGWVGLGEEGMLHKVVDHDVALDCPAVHCLWCRTLASMDGRPRGSLSRPTRDAPGLADAERGVLADAGRGGKSLTVDEMLRRQAKARRRLALPSDSPYVLYYEFATSIHAPSSGTLQVLWLQ